MSWNYLRSLLYSNRSTRQKQQIYSITRFNTRSEAEHHRARLGRLLGNPALLVVCFEMPDGETTDDFSSPLRLNADDLWRA